MTVVLCFLIAVIPLPLKALLSGSFVSDGPATSKRVALSFDDGPGRFTPKVLEILNRYQLHATFFMNGDQVQIRPKIALQVKEAGHEIGDHTQNHSNFYVWEKRLDSKKLKEKVKDQMMLSKEAIEKATGVRPVICRMPYGYSRGWVKEVAREEGYVLVNWSFGCDWKKISPEEKKEAYIHAIHPGAIFLMHDGGLHREGTLVALEGLIQELQKRHYEIVTVGKLIGMEKP